MLDRSMLTVVTQAMAKRLVPVATVRSELGLDSSADTKLARLIDAMSEAFAGQDGLRRPLCRQTYLERTVGFGGVLLPLSRWPVESVTSVTDGAETPTTIAASEYAIAGERNELLYRRNGWARAAAVANASAVSGAELYDLAVTYVAGWLPPGSGPGLVTAWTAATAIVAGAFVKPAAAANGQIALLYECTTAGTTHAATEPTWPTTVGATVVDNTVTWTARAAKELPYDIQEAALLTVARWYEGELNLPSGIQAESADGISTAYDFVGLRTQRSIPPFAQRILGGWR